MTSPSLPWQRETTTGTNQTWLSLLILKVAGAPDITPRELKNLHQPVGEAGTKIYSLDAEVDGGFYEPGQSPDDLVEMIDLPTDVFLEILPKANELFSTARLCWISTIA